MSVIFVLFEGEISCFDSLEWFFNGIFVTPTNVAFVGVPQVGHGFWARAIKMNFGPRVCLRAYFFENLLLHFRPGLFRPGLRF